MSCEVPLRFVSFLALVALEWPLHHVSSCVGFQMARVGGSIVALVATEWPLSCVLLHYVKFQTRTSDAQVLTVHTLCIYVAFHQSPFSYEFVGSLMSLFCIHSH